ncbi:hypothetical protein AALB47_25770 [Lachnospiraceae bacterium 54-11]
MAWHIIDKILTAAAIAASVWLLLKVLAVFIVWIFCMRHADDKWW